MSEQKRMYHVAFIEILKWIDMNNLNNDEWSEWSSPNMKAPTNPASVSTISTMPLAMSRAESIPRKLGIGSGLQKVLPTVKILTPETSFGSTTKCKWDVTWCNYSIFTYLHHNNQITNAEWKFLFSRHETCYTEMLCGWACAWNVAGQAVRTMGLWDGCINTLLQSHPANDDLCRVLLPGRNGFGRNHG